MWSQVHMANGASTEILTTADASRWAEVVASASNHDVFHLLPYHRFSEALGEGEARMLVFQEGGHVIAFPVLLRSIEIPGLSAHARGWKDVTSVYGYPGPIASQEAVPGPVRQHFVDFLEDYFASERVVAAFTRLHPLLRQEAILAGYGQVVDIGWTVSIDLTLSEEAQWSAYPKSNRYQIRRLRRMGFTCREAGREHLDRFVAIYHETLNRVGRATTTTSAGPP
jgi:hypothetical protein